MSKPESTAATPLQRSLMRTARKRANDLTDGRRVRDRLAAIGGLMRRRYSLWASVIYVVLVVPLFLPVRWHLPALQTDESATDFVGTAWEVKAAVVAVSLAVVLFAFESVRGSRWGVTLREFARDGHLLEYVHVGMASLIVDWLVLLHIGTDAPSGWAGTWSAVLSAATIVSIPL